MVVIAQLFSQLRMFTKTMSKSLKRNNKYTYIYLYIFIYINYELNNKKKTPKHHRVLAQIQLLFLPGARHLRRGI